KPAKASTPPAAPEAAPREAAPKETPRPTGVEVLPPSPAARRALAEAGLSPADVKGTGRRGQILKHDVPPPQKVAAAAPAQAAVRAPTPVQGLRVPPAPIDEEREQRVKMTRLRQTIARRLKD